MRHVAVSEDCWTWRHPLADKIVPRLRVDGREVAATHVAWRIAYGDWPPGRYVARLCGNRLCVRPRHLGILNWSDLHRLRADRLEMVVYRRCAWCEKPIRVRRSMALKGWGRFCSTRCYHAAA